MMRTSQCSSLPGHSLDTVPPGNAEWLAPWERRAPARGCGRASARSSRATPLTPHLSVTTCGWHPESVEFLGTSSTSSMTRHPLPPADQTATRLTQSPTHPPETPTRSLLLSVPAINLAGGYRVDSSHDSSPQSTPRLVSGAQAAALRCPACAAVHHLPPGGRLADPQAQTN